MAKMLTGCPVCSGTLQPTELTCGTCRTRIQSVFEPCHFCRLSEDQLQFVALFLRNRGNITAMSEDLGISHPTVARRLDSILSALTGGVNPPVEPTERDSDRRDCGRKEILEMLDRGDITAEEATKKLREL